MFGPSASSTFLAKWTILLSCPASLLGGSRWVGLGLSRDAVMGEDWVVWCGTGPRDSRPVLGTAWNSGRSSLVTQQTGQVRLVAASLQEDGLFCKLQLDNWIEGRPPQVQNKYNAIILSSDLWSQAGSARFTLQLDRDEYHVLVAGGPRAGPGLGYHGPSSRLASQAIDRKQVQQKYVANE